MLQKYFLLLSMHDFLINQFWKIFQGKGYGSRILDFAESLAGIAQIQIEVVSCRSDLFPYYVKKGFKEVRRYPFEEYNPACKLTRSGIKMVVMQKIREIDQNWFNFFLTILEIMCNKVCFIFKKFQSRSFIKNSNYT